ncbi:hypothetical protein FSARC_2265 [Fusarium sarcochroum]|uniref:Protein kinase domain-containing protein n=1 Tax=Fusarium sarcochroum TaxID=1208366 RepID=A0A8H4U6Z7_9HYPO|nr:hypothetical protein FSARC_2265 [Fusarium sarcochroum]
MLPLKPLPDCEGPKLAPFEHNLEADDVEFLKIMERETAHGKVIKTRIGDSIYAIKLFVHETYVGSPRHLAYGEDGEFSLCCDAFESRFTPFENECRAFGRLQEAGCEHLAVKIHGYVALELTKVIDQKLQVARSKMRWPYLELVDFLSNGDGPTMGIVKDWVDMAECDNEDLRERYDRITQINQFPRMLEDLHELHKSGIVVRDLKSDQYVNGILVDLSFAMTVPHPYGPDPSGLGRSWQPRWTWQSMAAWDLYCFQTRVIDTWRKGADELFEKVPRPKGMKKTCSMRAYDLSSRSRNLRPRAGQQQRPFLPLLNHEGLDIEMAQTPRYDPGDLIVNQAKRVTKNVKKRRAKAATSQKPKRGKATRK